MWEWMKQLPTRFWAWLALGAGGAVLFAGVYFAGRNLRKGDVDIERAKRELDKANKSYTDSVKQTQEIHEKQKKLVSDILAEQLVRAEETKRVKGLTDEQVLDELRARGDILPAESDR